MRGSADHPVDPDAGGGDLVPSANAGSQPTPMLSATVKWKHEVPEDDADPAGSSATERREIGKRRRADHRSLRSAGRGR